MKVEVYKCRFTGEIFEKKEKIKYVKHLKELRTEMKESRMHKRLCIEFHTWFEKEKESITHIKMIPEWFLKNQRMIMDACNANVAPVKGGSNSWADPFYSTDEFTKIEITDVRWSDTVSNSHSCPHNGVTNWGGQRPDAPRGYPGWRININGTLKRAKKHMSRYPYGLALNMVGIKTGTGGGGNTDFRYGAEIFIADWSGLQQQLVFEKLKGVA